MANTNKVNRIAEAINEVKKITPSSTLILRSFILSLFFRYSFTVIIMFTFSV